MVASAGKWTNGKSLDNARIHRAETKAVTRMSETNEASVQSVVMQSVLNGNDALFFLERFSFWSVTRQGSGRIVVVVRTGEGYVRLYGRKCETVCELLDRLCQKVQA